MLLLGKRLERYRFFVGVRRQRIDSGEVDDFDVLIIFDRPHAEIDRHAREVADVAPPARDAVEQSCFARILIADQQKSHHCSASTVMRAASARRSVR